jgi:hypothetical protein
MKIRGKKKSWKIKHGRKSIRQELTGLLVLPVTLETKGVKVSSFD